MLGLTQLQPSMLLDISARVVRHMEMSPDNENPTSLNAA